MSYGAREVQWYLRNGRYPKHRISRDATGQEYVIGDDGWNHPSNPPEWIEQQMQRDLQAGEVTP